MNTLVLALAVLGGHIIYKILRIWRVKGGCISHVWEDGVTSSVSLRESLEGHNYTNPSMLIQGLIS